MKCLTETCHHNETNFSHVGRWTIRSTWFPPVGILEVWTFVPTSLRAGLRQTHGGNGLHGFHETIKIPRSPFVKTFDCKSKGISNPALSIVRSNGENHSFQFYSWLCSGGLDWEVCTSIIYHRLIYWLILFLKYWKNDTNPNNSSGKDYSHVKTVTSIPGTEYWCPGNTGPSKCTPKSERATNPGACTSLGQRGRG